MVINVDMFQAPEFFYRILEEKLHILELSGLAEFVDALERLPSLTPHED